MARFLLTEFYLSIIEPVRAGRSKQEYEESDSQKYPSTVTMSTSEIGSINFHRGSDSNFINTKQYRSKQAILKKKKIGPPMRLRELSPKLILNSSIYFSWNLM